MYILRFCVNQAVYLHKEHTGKPCQALFCFNTNTNENKDFILILKIQLNLLSNCISICRFYHVTANIYYEIWDTIETECELRLS